ncbi:MAG: peptidase S58 family protein [Deltaproteobacteria bacterium]|nr:MAG: peptidase S58 family protein [Deltaproteobacteria bacterium]
MSSPTSVPGVFAGHWTHERGTTGCTAFLFPEGAVAGVWAPGSAAGSRELAVLESDQLAPHIHGLSLSGGSAFGLSAADGVMAVLAEQGIGFQTPHGAVPIVPAAVLFDLERGPWRPDAEAGRHAAEAASSRPLAEGRLGAGAGATVAKFAGGSEPGGFGCSGYVIDDYTLGAGAAVNALGSIRDPETGAFVAGPPPIGLLHPEEAPSNPLNPRGQTTLVVVVTDAPMTKSQCKILAKMASAGLARATYPAFSPFDGDTVFCVSTGKGTPVEAGMLTRLGHAAAVIVARAIVRGVTRGG